MFPLTVNDHKFYCYFIVVAVVLGRVNGVGNEFPVSFIKYKVACIGTKSKVQYFSYELLDVFPDSHKVIKHTVKGHP